MKHLIKSNPQHVWNQDGSKLQGEVAAAQERKTYQHRLEIPHYLKVQPGTGVLTMIVPFDTPIAPQDTITNEYTFEGMVTEVLERRPAMGIWSYTPKPHFVKVRYM